MTRRRPVAPGFDRLHVFVPAIMSVGIVFWIVTLTRDLFHWRGEQSLDRRSRLSGRAAADFVLSGPAAGEPAMPGLRMKVSYLLTAAVFGGLALYVLIGSAANYARQGGYIGDIAWLLAVSLLVATAFGFVAGVAVAVVVAWPRPPAVLHGILRSTPLTGRAGDDPGASLGGPSWGLSTAANLLPVAAAAFTVVVAAGPSALARLDRVVAEWAVGQPFGWFATLDPSRTVAVLVLAVIVLGAASLRCRALAVTLPVVAALGVAAVAAAGALVRRSDEVPTSMAAFPNLNVTVVVLLAGTLPLAATVLLGRPRLTAPLQVLGALWVAAVTLGALQDLTATATTALGGALVGLAGVVAVHWSVAHTSWHDHCRGCTWAPMAAPPPLLSAIPLRASHDRLLRLLAHLSAAGAAIGLAVLAVVWSVPSNPDGELLGAHIQRPVQLALAALVSIGALLAWRFEALGAVLIAVAAVGLGVFAGLEYRPEVALAMTGALLVPSVLLWLGWQHRRARWELAVLAVVTLGLLGATWAGASQVHEHYFGPTHPESPTEALPVDAVRWVWSGALQSRSATVVAGGMQVGASARVVLRAGDDGAGIDGADGDDGGGDEVRSPAVEVDADGIARLPVEGLRPSTTYSYRVEVDGAADRTRGNGTLRTPADGPTSFTVALGACARNGSNGEVFDTIAEMDPLMFLSLGDIHYSNIGNADPAAFRSAYERLLEQPAQSALYRQVPIAYTWDDHDYGPNNADGSSPSRPAARAAYRQVVPSYELPEGDDAPIYQAFTIGRVRFVLTDNRSERSAGSMLGPEQEAWLVDELTTASRTHALVVWANPVPWVGPEDPLSDGWAAYPDERRRIAEAISDNAVDNLVMLSGDAHMVALDDGTNTDYSRAGDAGFPLLHAAALDRPGSVKGGPYSHGTFPGSGQFGTIEVHDDGGDMRVELTGWTHTGARLVSETFTFPEPGAS